MQLSANQQRIIGCLLEKQSTTPEHYPLSLNGLVNACNQKSNRDPVLSLTESDVQNTLDELIELRLVTIDEGLSGRVNKYDHRFCNICRCDHTSPAHAPSQTAPAAVTKCMVYTFPSCSQHQMGISSQPFHQTKVQYYVRCTGPPAL